MEKYEFPHTKRQYDMVYSAYKRYIAKLQTTVEDNLYKYYRHPSIRKQDIWFHWSLYLEKPLILAHNNHRIIIGGMPRGVDNYFAYITPKHNYIINIEEI